MIALFIWNVKLLMHLEMLDSNEEVKLWLKKVKTSNWSHKTWQKARFYFFTSPFPAPPTQSPPPT